MPARKIMLILGAGWLACQVFAWVHPYFTEPTGDGFVKGMNLIALFMTWQSLAVVIAVGMLAVRLMRGDELSKPMIWLGQGPIMLQGLAVTLATLFFMFAD